MVRRFQRRSLAICAALIGLLPAGVCPAADLVFASYNLENYFHAADFPDGREKISKSPESIAAEIHVVQDIHPDILGVCEMGPPNEFDDFKARLKAAGLDYPYTEYVNGPDPERHVALLSRYPIASRQSVAVVPYEMDGQEDQVCRGFLDVTINVNGTNLRFIGVHLKSKLRDTRQNEFELRRHEAHLLRQHIDDVLNADAGAKLIVYGDFNDTKNERCMKEIMGGRTSDHGLRDLWLKDSSGDHWTEYWSQADVYSRIDYILVTPGLRGAVDDSHSYVYRSPYWNQASDHRAVVATFHTGQIQ